MIRPNIATTFFSKHRLDKPSAIIPVGIADPAYRDVLDWRPKSNGIPTILFYGTYIPLQGVETIIRAIPMTQNNYNARLIGRGQTFDNVQTMAKKLKLSGRVAFASPVPAATLPSELADANVVLGIFGTTDKAARVVPNKVVQAAAAGRPIITRDSSAIRRYFTHQKDIYLVPAGAPEALADAIDTLNASPHLCERLGAGARRVFDTHFSPPVIASKFMRAIREAEAQ